MEILLQRSYFNYKLLLITTKIGVMVHKRFYPKGLPKPPTGQKVPLPHISPNVPPASSGVHPGRLPTIIPQKSSGPAFPKPSITAQGYAAQKDLEHAQKHQTQAQAQTKKAIITQEQQPQKLQRKPLLHRPNQHLRQEQKNQDSPETLITTAFTETQAIPPKLPIPDIQDVQDAQPILPSASISPALPVPVSLPILALSTIDTVEEPTSIIPPPPPMPPTLLTKPMDPTKITGTNHVSQIQELAKLKTNSDANILPSSISGDKKLKYLKPVFKTKITSETKIADLTKPQLLEELKGRELVKDDDGKTDVDVLLANGATHHLGKSANNVKLTPKGQAYVKEIHSQTALENPGTPLKNSTKNEEPQFMIIIPPKSTENLLVETGKQTHLLITHKGDNDYYATGFFTSKNSGLSVYVSEEQFIKFQKQQEGQQIFNDKKQYYVPFDQPIKLDKNDVQPVKWDKEYIARLSSKTLDELTFLWKEIENEPVISFNKDGVTSEDALQMCLAHDATIAQGKPHPMTPDQIEQHKKGLEKQKAAQLAKKSEKTEKFMKDKENNNIQNAS
jgi:hypothetical protein